MSDLICKSCGGVTNTTTSDNDPREWAEAFNKGKVGPAKKCYVKWVDNKPVKGCAYDMLLKGWYKDWCQKIFKGKILKSKK